MNEFRKKDGKSIISGAFSLTVSTLVVKLLGMIYKIPLAQFLGEEGMGYFNSAYTVYTLFYILCTAGVPKAVMILISQRKTDEQKIVRVGIKTFLVFGVIVSAAFMIFAHPLSKAVGNSGAYMTMLAIAPSIVFISLSGVIRGYLSANLSFAHIATSQVIEGAAKLVLGLIFAIVSTRLSHPLIVVSALTILGVTLGAFFGLLYLVIVSKINVFSDKSGQRINCSECSDICKSIFHVSVPITISAAVMSITSIIDLGLIMRRLISIGYSESTAVSLYGNFTTLAMPMFNLAVSIITPISVTFLPVYARANAASDKDGLYKAIKMSLELTGLVSAPITIGMFVYSREILSMLFGDVGVSLGASLLRLTVPGVFFMSLLLIVNSALEACGNVRVPMISMAIGSIFKLVISYLLIGNEEYGIAGAPIGTVISYAVALILSLVIATKKLGYAPPILRTNIPSYLCALTAVSLSTLVFAAVKTHTNQSIALILAIIVSALLYAFICFVLGIFSKKKLIEMSKYTKLT